LHLKPVSKIWKQKMREERPHEPYRLTFNRYLMLTNAKKAPSQEYPNGHRGDAGSQVCGMQRR
jgi:hypothetical protein